MILFFHSLQRPFPERLKIQIIFLNLDSSFGSWAKMVNLYGLKVNFLVQLDLEHIFFIH